MISLQKNELRKKVLELLVIRASGFSFDSQRQYPLWELPNEQLKYLLKQGLGGVILHGGSVQEIKNRSITLRRWAKQSILLCADVEEGVGQRFEGGSWLPPPMALGLRYAKNPQEALYLAEQYGRCIGSQARRCGLNWVLAPVCDVNSNPLNPVINMRAWGKDPHTVSALVCSFHRGLISQGVLSCAKHFPGHGDTRVDSHLELPILDNDFSRLKEIELIPFKDLIDNGVHSVMTAHILLKKIDSAFIATFSKKLLSHLLREKLGFQGLIVTDALIMKAITKKYGPGEAAVMAFEAGADLILMPENPFEAIEAIVEALIKGRIPVKRLEQSLERRYRAISKLNSFDCDSFDDEISFNNKEFEQSDDQCLVKKIIDISVEIRNNLSSNDSNGLVNLIRVDDILPCKFLSKSSPAFLIPKKFGYKNVLFHSLGVDPWKKDSNDQLALDRFGKGPFLLQLFVRGNPFQGNQNETARWKAVVHQLQSKDLLSALIVYGSFYFWHDLSKVLNPSIPTAYSPGQMPAAQQKTLDAFFQNDKEQTLIKENVIKFTD